MQLKTVLMASAAALMWSTAATAQTSVLERLANMEKRMQYLEKRVASQDEVIVRKDREIARLKKTDEEKSSRWFNKIALTGGVELEASHSNPYTGDSTSDATVATATVGLATQVHDWVGAEISLLYEEDDTPLEVDTASITVAPPDGPWRFQGGQIYVPFGSFETNLVSDPLTLEIGETRETALLTGVEHEGFFGSVYAFNGTNDNSGDSNIDGYGANLGLVREGESGGYSVSLGYISDLGDSDTLQDAISSSLGSNTVTRYVPGWTASGKVNFGPVTVLAEYLSALNNFHASEVAFNGAGAEPSAWTVETAYGFRIGERDATFAVSYQGTDEALALELPERRFLAGFSIGLIEHASLAFEWAHDWDYGTGDGGTGKTADTVTGQLAVEF